MAACKDCRFGVITTEGVRRCFRFPPTLLIDGANWHPFVEGNNWCGEFYDRARYEHEQQRGGYVRTWEGAQGGN